MVERLLKGVPLIDSKAKEDKLKVGQYGQGYDADGNLKTFRKGDDAPLSTKWGLQEQIVNQLFFMGFGAKIFGTLDYAVSQIVPGGDDPTLAEAIAEHTSERELFRETHPRKAALGDVIGAVGPAAAVKSFGKLINRIPIVKKVGNLPNWLKNIVTTATIVGTTTAGEADPGQEISEFEVGATRGAVTAAVLYPIFSALSIIGGGIRGRLDPRWGSKNLINTAFNRHDLARLAETASEEELAAMEPVLRNMSPGYREVYERFTELKPDAVLADAFPEGIAALLKAITRQTGANRDMLKDILESRGNSETERLVAAIDLYVSNLTGEGSDLAEALSDAASPYYDHAFDIEYISGGDLPATAEQLEQSSQRSRTNTPRYNTNLISAGIARVLGTPTGRRAFNEALESFNDEYFFSRYTKKQAEVQLNRILGNSRYDEAGQLENISPNANGFSLEFLDRVKRELGNYVSQAVRTGDEETSRIASRLTSELRDELDRLDETGSNPGQQGNLGSYKVARETAKSKFDLEKAYEAGTNFRQDDPRDIKSFLEIMSPGEQRMYRAGAAASLRKWIESIPETGQATPRIFSRTRNMNQIMNLVAPDQRAGLKEAIIRERAYALTQKGALGGGAGQLVPDEQAKEALGSIAVLGAGKAVPGANVLLLAGAVRRAVVRFLQGGQSDQQTVALLLEQDPEKTKQILRALSALPQDPNALRLRDLVVHALALQTRTVDTERAQVPVGEDQYQIRRKVRTPLGDILMGAYRSAGEILQR